MHAKDYQAQFKLVYDALDGSGGFYDFTYLIQHPREPEEKYARRQGLAWYDNRLKPACAGFVGYIDKKPALRDFQGNEFSKAFADDCDKCGNSLAVWLSSFMINAKARGTMFALVDSPRTLPASQAEQQNNRDFSYLVMIRPEDVSELELDDFGNVLKIRWSDCVGTKTVQRMWDATGWEVISGTVTESGEHGLGICPVVPFSEELHVPYVGPFAQIAAMSKRLMNMHSEKDEIQRGQTFSILNYVVPRELRGAIDISALATSIGVDNLLMSYDTAAQFISPEAGPLDSYMADILAMELRIDEVALKVSDSKTAESGVARDMRFQALNAALVSFSTRMEDFERRVWALFALTMGLPESRTVVNWNKNYSLSDVKTEIENAAAVESLGMPDSFKRAQNKRIARLMLADVDQEALDAIIEDIDAQEFEVVTPPELTEVDDDPNKPQ